MQRRLALAEAERTELSSNLDALKEENSALKDQLRAFFEADAQKDIEKQVPQPVVPDSFQQEEGKMPASPAVMLSPRSHIESQLPEAIRVLLPTSLLTVNEETGPALVESESVSTALEGIFHLLRTLRGQQAEQTCRIREQQVRRCLSLCKYEAQELRGFGRTLVVQGDKPMLKSVPSNQLYIMDAHL